MPLKNLEHAGGEDFNEIKDRARVLIDLLEEEAKLEPPEATKERQQREWLSPNNPFLWLPLDFDD